MSPFRPLGQSDGTALSMRADDESAGGDAVRRRSAVRPSYGTGRHNASYVPCSLPPAKDIRAHVCAWVGDLLPFAN